MPAHFRNGSAARRVRAADAEAVLDEVRRPQLPDEVEVVEGDADVDELGVVTGTSGGAGQEHGEDRVTTAHDRRDALGDTVHFAEDVIAFHQLTVNSLVQLVTVVETMVGDVIRAVVARYPTAFDSTALSVAE